jgi:hypothetical protein
VRYVRRSVAIAALLVAGLSIAGMPVSSGAVVASRTSTHRAAHGSSSGVQPATSPTPSVVTIPPATGPGVMSGGIATSSHIIEARSKDARVVKPRAVSIPKGWKSYTYGGVTISVPKSWAVKHNTNCHNTSAPGALLLGYPKTPFFCPSYQYSISFVAIHGSMGAIPPAGSPVKVNGLTVDVGAGTPEQLEWTIPSFGLQVTASGSEGERILHTLRRS